MNKLSIKQKMLLEAIEYFRKENGYSPTIKELCELLGFKYPNSVFSMLMSLENKGYVSTVNGKSRTIKVLKKYDD